MSGHKKIGVKKNSKKTESKMGSKMYGAGTPKPPYKKGKKANPNAGGLY